MHETVSPEPAHDVRYEPVVNGIVARLKSSPHTLTVYADNGKSEHAHQALYPRVMAAAAVLRRRLGAQRRVGIVAENSLEFFLVDLACIAAGICTVCIDHHGELDADCVTYFNHLSVDTVIQRGAASAVPHQLNVWTFAELLEPSGPGLEEQEGLKQWAGSELLTIKQTSGSTGLPKAIGATVSSIDDTLCVVQALFSHDTKDRVLVFLPLYLVQQRYWLYSSIYFGFDAVLTSSKYALAVLSAAAPTVVMGVPKFYDVLKERIQYKAQLLASSGTHDSHRRPNGANDLLPEAARATLGPNIRYLWTGSAPCSHAALEFFWQLKVPLLEGYGTNETDIVSKNSFDDFRLGSVGKVLPNRRVLLSESGQISVWKKYRVTERYELGEDDVGGFEGDTFVTGDLGHIDKDGYLYIDGRIGDAFVLESGATIHPSEIELRLQRSELINFAVVCGKNRPYLVAVVDPVNPTTERKALEQAVYSLTSSSGSAKRIGRLVVSREPFSITNGCLSPQMKIVRRRILQEYAQEIDACYTQ